MELPKELIDNLKENKVVPLIGAGMSRLFGYPGWKELIVKVSREVGHPIDEEEIGMHDNLQMAEALLQHHLQTDQLDLEVTELINNTPDLFKSIKVNNKSLHRYIYQEKVKQKETKFNQIVINSLLPETIDTDELTKFNYLKEIPFRHIITTNYDDVLENHIFNDKEYMPLVPQTGQEFEITDDDNLLIKLHGDCEKPESIVFTQSQYYRFMNDMVYYNSRLQTILAHNTLLMIGYGFGDINIHDVYFKFLDHLENNHGYNDNKKSYIVLTDFDRSYFARNEVNGGEPTLKDSKYYELYVKFLKSKKIEVIEAPNLDTFLLKLHEEYIKSIRLTKETAQILLDEEKPIIHKIFMEKEFSEVLDIKTLELLVQKPVVFDEWIEEKVELRELEIFEKTNDYYHIVQGYISKLVTTERSTDFLYLIGLSANIVSQTATFHEHKNRLKKLIDTIAIIDLSAYRRKELRGLIPDELKVFVESFRDIFQFATTGFGKAWDSHRLLTNTLRAEKYKIFELYIWSLDADLQLLKDRLSGSFDDEDILDEWYDLKDLLITSTEMAWLEEIAIHKFQKRISNMLDLNQKLTSRIRKIINPE